MEAGVAWVEVVAGVYGGTEDGGVGGVAGSFVEIDKAVEEGGGSDPLVDGFADLVAGGAGVAGAHVGGDGGADDFEAVGVGPGDELGEAGDEVVGGDDVVGAGGIVGVADVVDGFEEDDVFDAGGGEDVGVKAGESAGAPAVVEDAIAADAFVDDGEVAGGGVVVEADGEEVGPGVVGAGGAVPAVGDAVAKGYYGSGLVAGGGGGFDFYTFEELPDAGGGGVGEGGGGDLVVVGDVVGFEGEVVGGEGGDVLTGEGEADGEVGEGSEGEGDGVAYGDAAGGDGDAGVSVEGEGDGGVGLNGAGWVGCGAGGEGCGGTIDDQGADAQFVGEDDAEGGAAEGDMDDLAEGGGHGEGFVVVRAGDGRGSPGGYPVGLRLS